MIRFRLTHGPIDCLCGVEGPPAEMAAARARAEAAFGGILPGLCEELPLIRTPLPSERPNGPIARAMHDAVGGLASSSAATLFITPMAAVAGAVADHILAVIVEGARMTRAFVNNGGDIAIHLARGQTMKIGMVTDLTAPSLDATVSLTHSCGVATSGRACKGQGGKSFSFGIADAVTVIAAQAAVADAAATLIANAVDLPNHPAVIRRPASDIDLDSDLGSRLITWHLGTLTDAEIHAALDGGQRKADALLAVGLIEGAALALRGRLVTCGGTLASRDFVPLELAQQEAA